MESLKMFSVLVKLVVCRTSVHVRKPIWRCTSVYRCNRCSNGALENEDGDESDNVPDDVDTTDTDESDGEYGD